MKQHLFITIALAFCFSVGNAQNLSKTIDINGQSRGYRIFIPPGYNSGEQFALLIALHGLGDNATNFQGVGFNTMADTAKFIAVYPNGLPDPLLGGNAWNVGLNPANNTNDIGFLTALLDTLMSEYSIDSTRVYFCGFSMGGFMSYRVACQLGERVAAIASVSGTLPTAVIAGCAPGGAMPALHLHGTSDQTIPYPNSPIFGLISNIGADSTARYWAWKNECGFPAEHDTLPDTKNDGLLFEKFSWKDCKDSSEVILIKANNMTHTWPGSNNDINATQEIWNFFSRHKKREPMDTTGTFITVFKKEIKLFPNPATNSIFIQAEFSEQWTATVRDLAGRELKRINFTNISGFEMPVDDLQDGVYLLEVNNGKEIMKGKFVKMNK